MPIAQGRFQVTMTPQAETGSTDGVSNLGRMALDKVFEGDLAGTGKGEMLTAMTQTPGSAGYVAIERFSGSLHGRQGGFVFQHSGTMTRGEKQLSITVVADSGVGELAGIRGEFSIRIIDGQHLYTFDYDLPG
ncbi:DUF3224 domain-containing protein [Chitinimonas sp. BJYL2]|uniref:DUF3224 domain-containing protein n=1 Tax=Chitinimonas sp. BJYL2 TaxID=2976696 RepID=UPI0022B4F9F4|nr:DUF3224 domain-containing protein [Chitinimonas sp. BJYL2]